MCLTKSCPINSVYHGRPPITVLKHLKDDQEKWVAPELNFKCHSAYVNAIFKFFLLNKFAKFSFHKVFALSFGSIECGLMREKLI